MKTLYFIAAFLFAALHLQASLLASDLNLNLQYQSWFNVKLDNHIYESPVAQFQIGGIPAGNHNLEVVRLDHGFYGPYTVPVTIYCGSIYLAPGTRTEALIDWYGNLRIINVIAMQPVWHPQLINPECNSVPAPVHGMNDANFDRLINTIDNLSFESSKIKVVKQALQHQKVTAFQVAELNRLMTFESTRLEIAKFAYHKTIDKQNYYIVNDTFTFESSIDDLNDFIERS